jgi:hypothetical protein
MNTRVRVIGNICKGTFVAVLAMLLAAGCDSSEQAFAPVKQEQTSASVVGGTDGRTYTLVEGQINFKRATASAWINRGGGTVMIEGDSINGRPTMHVLIVPEGVVKKKTLFTMTIASNHYVRVGLRAQIEHKYRGQVELIDVGHLGFDKPVWLGLDRSLASNVPAGSRLTVLYDPENGQPFEAMPTTVYAGYEQWVIGYLNHFSKYALAMD